MYNIIILKYSFIMLIFGSCAARHWFPNFRLPSDVDVIAKNDYWVDGFQMIMDNNQHDQYVDPNFLYTIKCSHAAWDIHWDKTMHDCAWLKKQGCTIDQQIYDQLFKDWTRIHRNKQVKLTGTNTEFFKLTINRKYDHDRLHQQLCFYQRPLHEQIRPNPDLPWCSKALWDQLSFDDQIKTAIEEIRVIATERMILNGEPSLYRARYQATKQLITNMTTGWFNQFLIENIETLMTYETTTWQQQLKNILN